jgi:hypothetical protein
MNSFNVPVTIFRNRVWTANFTLFDAEKNPFDVSGDGLALFVFPTPPVTGSVPVIANRNPGVETNVVSFVTPDAETEPLVAAKPYTWQFVRSPSGTTGTTTVVVGGPLTVEDSPPWNEGVSP